MQHDLGALAGIYFVRQFADQLFARIPGQRETVCARALAHELDVAHHDGDGNVLDDRVQEYLARLGLDRIQVVRINGAWLAHRPAAAKN
jgi:hypothetical protein